MLESPAKAKITLSLRPICFQLCGAKITAHESLHITPSMTSTGAGTRLPFRSGSSQTAAAPLSRGNSAVGHYRQLTPAQISADERGESGAHGALPTDGVKYRPNADDEFKSRTDDFQLNVRIW